MLNKYWHKNGHLDINQRDYLLKVLNELKPKYCLEIGFATGRSCITTLSVNPKKIVSIDIDLDYMNARDFSKELLKNFKNLTIIEGNSLILFETDFLDIEFPLGIDFIFVDGGHKYEEAINDIKKTYEHLNNGGVMIVDDYMSGPPNGYPLPEVTDAVNDFCEEYNIKQDVWNYNGKGFAIIKKNHDN